MRTNLIIILALLTFSVSGFAQLNNSDTVSSKKDYAFDKKELIVPGIFIGYGVLSLTIDGVRNWDYSINNKILAHNYSKTSADDYLQFAPVFTVYALNLCGVQGKHNLKERSIIYATTLLVTTAITFPIKTITHRQRPDESDYHSFPSGHTATAFAAAEFMRQEYKDVSPWFGIAGYGMAVGTGALRMYNNKHWMSDVITGAGVGILSTHIAYWMFPTINKLFTKKSKTISSAMAAPYYNGQQFGMSMVVQL